jgi:hypothetical protein
MEETQLPTTRVRLNFTQTAKGLGQMDITAEAPTLEEAKSLMSNAIDEMRAIFKEKEIKEAGKE